MLSRRAFLGAGLASLAACAARTAPGVALPPAPGADPFRRVLWPTEPWEAACAMPFSGGVHRDAADGLWKCWYMGGWPKAPALGLALSADGLHWAKPHQDVVAGTNIVLDARGQGLDTATVVPHGGRWYLGLTRGPLGPLELYDSADGVHWGYQGQTPPVGDRTTLFYNHLRGRWGFSVRTGAGCCGDPRRAELVESETFVPTAWAPQPWLAADALDPCEGGYCGAPQAQLYAVDVVPHGDRLLALLTVWRGLQPNRPKLNDVCWAVSADGLTWSRPDRHPVLEVSDDPASWHYGNVQGVAGGVHHVNGQWRVYGSGRSAAEACALGVRVLDRAPWA